MLSCIFAVPLFPGGNEVSKANYASRLSLCIYRYVYVHHAPLIYRLFGEFMQAFGFIRQASKTSMIRLCHFSTKPSPPHTLAMPCFMRSIMCVYAYCIYIECVRLKLLNRSIRVVSISRTTNVDAVLVSGAVSISRWTLPLRTCPWDVNLPNAQSKGGMGTLGFAFVFQYPPAYAFASSTQAV